MDGEAVEAEVSDDGAAITLLAAPAKGVTVAVSSWTVEEMTPQTAEPVSRDTALTNEDGHTVSHPVTAPGTPVTTYL